MESRERVIRAIEMTGPDRPPITHATLYGAIKRHGAALEAFHARYPSDVVSVGEATDGEFSPVIGVPSKDTWGAEWVRTNDEHKGQVVRSPLADWSRLDGFKTPDTASDEIMAALQANLDRNAGRLYTMADGDIIWQRMIYLRGYQRTLEDLMLEPRCSARFRDLIVSVMIRRVEKLVQLPSLDAIAFRDDWGTQLSLMIQPSLWREFFRPSYAELFRLTRQAGKHVWFHSDGVIDTIIPDLIEMGANVLNPQVDAMGRPRVAELCGGKVAIQGDIDRQTVLPFGTPDDCRRAVRADIDAFGRTNGGYIGRAESAGDVPLENLVAVYDEVLTYGGQVYRG